MVEYELESAQLKALIFDLDGTLYRQDSLRRAMAVRLVRAHLGRPRLGMRTARVLTAYRQAQERLRDFQSVSSYSGDLVAAQLQLTCEQTQAPPDFVSGCVSRWMETEPLPLLASRIQPGVVDLLSAARARGLKLAVLSDYPAEAKLRALGVDGWFDLVLSAQSPQVGVFKPHPRGIQVALDLFGLSPCQCAYIGDRADVDGAAAEAAGVYPYILGPGRGFAELEQLLEGTRLAQPLLELA